MSRGARIWLAVGMAASLVAACAPLTSPRTSLDLQRRPLDCRRFEQIYASSQLSDDLGEHGGRLGVAAAGSAPLVTTARARARKTFQTEGNARPDDAGETDENILILSGGAQWGAYGSGFIKGLYGAKRISGNDESLHLRDFNRITGISTGGMMTTFTWAAIVHDRSHPDDVANPWLDQLHVMYTYTDRDLFVSKQPVLGYSLFSNGIFDPAGLLAAKVEQGARDAWATLATDRTTRVSVGSANVLNGQFFTFDLVRMAAEPQAQSLACYREAILASSAIPLAFPPRFIDGEPFYDGGIQFLVYLDDLMTAMNNRPRPPRVVNIRVIVNGNQSPNDPGTDVARALACDGITVVRRGECAAVANSLLGVSHGPGKGLIPRTAQDIMVYQLKKDSVYRIYNDWLNMIRESKTPMHGTFRVTYIPNAQLADPASVGADPAPCQKSNSTDQFNQPFEACLYAIGMAKGRAGMWDFKDAM
jgi:predicted acylesterase/phospholipase RssA